MANLCSTAMRAGQLFLVLFFDFPPLGLKFLVLGEFFQFFQLVQVGHPFVPDFGGDQFGKSRIALFQPPPLRDAVGLIVKPLRIKIVEIRNHVTSLTAPCARRRPR